MCPSKDASVWNPSDHRPKFKYTLRKFIYNVTSDKRLEDIFVPSFVTAYENSHFNTSNSYKLEFF